VLIDDLTPPVAGQARVRVIHAAADNRTLDVVADTVAGPRPVFARGARFASTSPYASVPAGTWHLRVGAPAGKDGPAGAQVNCTVSAGGVYSVLLLDGRSGSLDVVTRADAQGGQRVPAGVVDTGFDRDPSPEQPGGVLTDTLFGLGAAAAGALTLAGAVVLRMRRRRRSV
jgi:hypothetical protein